MRIKTIFVAYPYNFGQAYRDAIQTRFSGTGVEFRYADDRLENMHVMDKVRRMMSESDVSFFDVTGNNPNVMLELGYAMGAEQPGFVVVHEDAVESLSADITGWDQLRYKDYADLANRLLDRITNSRVPQRIRVPTAQTIDLQPKTILRELRFGVPPVEAPLLCVYAIPRDYQRHYKDRALLGKAPFRAQDLCDAVLTGPNQTHHSTFFWPGGFDYSYHPGPDFIEVYEGRSKGRQADRITNFRVYTSGTATYMQRLREGGSAHKPFMYVYMFENIVEMALIAIAEARRRLTFEDQGDVAVGAVFLNADELHVSEATPDFYPANDTGRHLYVVGDEVWIPDEALLVDADALAQKAKALANEMAADLRSKLA